jgi:hypothetical protein
MCRRRRGDDAHDGVGDPDDDMSKLQRALRMRYGSPRAVLKKLGLDEDLLREEGEDRILGGPQRQRGWAADEPESEGAREAR